ncbi:MAG TPA: Na/Pi cotransporter family protein [Thermodesulfobacteriota bacterium]|nr:Na/Pi cotransporter family protein [Thermodesulfobacteriota bacterium]
MTSLTILSFFGSVLLMLYGMRLVGEGLQKAAGAKLRSFLLSATSNRFKSLFAGATITALMQSSSATTIMLVGFAGAGLVGLSETMGIILGADIGTTITVQLLAFKIYDYAIAIVGFGVLLRFWSSTGKFRDTGLAFIGFGFVFLSLKILIETFAPLAADPDFSSAIIGLGKDPLAGIIISALLTALLHSSAATLALAITAAHSGFLTLDAAMPIVLGANIGTCVSAVVSSIGAPVSAKRVALAHIMFKVLGVIIVYPFLGLLTGLAFLASTDMARGVAYGHTFFNIAIAALFLPFTGPFTKFVEYLLHDTAREKKSGPKYLDPIVLSTPSLALGQATREALSLADIVQEMLRDSLETFRTSDKTLIEKLQERDNDVDVLDREIKLYLTKLIRESLSEEQAGREFEILTFSNNMENIGDVIDKNLMELAKKKIHFNLVFSDDGMKEIIELHSKVAENFVIGVAVFTSGDTDLARRLLSHKARIAELEKEFREAHIGRLHRGFRESIETSAIHLDVLANLKRINSYICNIAYTVLEKEVKQ